MSLPEPSTALPLVPGNRLPAATPGGAGEDGSTRRLPAVGATRALQIFLAVIVLHLLEHGAQALQVFALGWPRPQALGFLGLAAPVLVSSETLHYFHAVATLAGLVAFRKHFHGAARHWWVVALVVQVWHHFEHLLLQGQWIAGQPLFGAGVPTSVLQLWVPRVELHLFYNAAVLVPMCVALMLDPAAWRLRGRRGSTESRR